jgi:hypothetical protein
MRTVNSIPAHKIHPGCFGVGTYSSEPIESAISVIRECLCNHNLHIVFAEMITELNIKFNDRESYFDCANAWMKGLNVDLEFIMVGGYIDLPYAGPRLSFYAKLLTSDEIAMGRMSNLDPRTISPSNEYIDIDSNSGC